MEKVGAGEERCWWHEKAVLTGKAAPQKPDLCGMGEKEYDRQEDKLQGCWCFRAVERDSVEGGEVSAPAADHRDRQEGEHGAENEGKDQAWRLSPCVRDKDPDPVKSVGRANLDASQ